MTRRSPNRQPRGPRAILPTVDPGPMPPCGDRAHHGNTGFEWGLNGGCACEHEHDECPCIRVDHIPAHPALGCPCTDNPYGETA